MSDLVTNKPVFGWEKTLTGYAPVFFKEGCTKAQRDALIWGIEILKDEHKDKKLIDLIRIYPLDEVLRKRP